MGLGKVSYKLVFKTITNRFKPFLSSVIHDSQSAFMEKMFITDNLIMTFEAFPSMNHGKIYKCFNYFAF